MGIRRLPIRQAWGGMTVGTNNGRNGQQQRQKQIPFGDDNQRGNGKDNGKDNGNGNGKGNGKDNGNGNGRSRSPSGMTTRGATARTRTRATARTWRTATAAGGLVVGGFVGAEGQAAGD
jgi:hypothetical protein